MSDFDNNASFLKMIGLEPDGDSEKKKTEQPSGLTEEYSVPEGINEEDFSADEFEAYAEEVVDGEIEGTEKTEEYTQGSEPTVKDEAVYDQIEEEDDDLDSASFLQPTNNSEATKADELTEADEPTDPDECVQEFEADVVDEKSQPDSWNQTMIGADEIFDEVSNVGDLNNRTAVYSEDEFEDIAQSNVTKEYEECDRLLDGLEEAEESRATDVFARSFRADSRKTRALGAQPDESLESFDEESYIEDPFNDASEPGAGLDELYEEDDESPSEQNIEENFAEENQAIEDQAYENQDLEELRESQTANPNRQTLAFDYDSTQNQPMFGKLVVVEGKIATGDEVAFDGFPIRVGRDPANEVSIDDSNVSRYHAEFRQEGEAIVLVDLGSTNGLKINGRVETEAHIHPHDIIQVGEVLFEFLPPGESKRGLKQVGAAHETQIRTNLKRKRALFSFGKGGRKSDRRKTMWRVAAGFFILAAALFFLKDSGFLNKGVQTAKNKSMQVLLSQAEKEFTDFRAELEQEAPLSEIPDATLKERFLAKVQAVPQLPEQIKTLFQNIDPTYLRIFVEDPAIFNRFAASGGDKQVIIDEVRTRMQLAQRDERWNDALAYSEILLQVFPNDPNLLAAQKEFRSKSNYLEIETVNDEITDEDRKRFSNYMTNFQAKVQTYVEAKNYEAAKKFALDVKGRILDLIKRQPAFASFAESAVAEWSSKIRFYDKKLQEQEKSTERRLAKIREGDRKLLQIRDIMNDPNRKDRLRRASVMVENFFKNYPNHPGIKKAKRFRKEIDEAIAELFNQTKQKVETARRSETYEFAWNALYNFLDQVPGYLPANDLKKELIEETKGKAQNFYNRARVYRYEADDLIAAKKFYQKAFETADPKGDLHAKAVREHERIENKTFD